MTRHVPLRLGMVGGGAGALIGNVHRIAARIDGEYQLVAGALSSTREKAQDSAAALGIAEDRAYDDFEAMAEAESARADGIEVVAICTPNHLHAAASKAFLARGIHVICDKPLTATMAQAQELTEAAKASDALFFLTHNYSAYPQIRLAREMVARGDLGRVRLVMVEYAQEWLTEPSDSKQAEWRSDPERAGAGGAIGDIGTHAFQLARFVTGMLPETLAADLTAFVPGRRLDDNANVLMRYAGGAKGTLWCSQVAPGTENGLKLRIYGDRGGLEWAHETPETLWFTPFGEATRKLRRGGPGTTDSASGSSRIPAGHPEGYLEGFANLYREAAGAIRALQAGRPLPDPLLVPDLQDGLEGLQFIDACIRSNENDNSWVKVMP